MTDVTRILNAIGHGDADAVNTLLPAVYEELRQMADHKLLSEGPGHTLQATALVHEAYLRLVDSAGIRWPCRTYFFGAAAEAMRRILIDHARKKGSRKRGGDRNRVDFMSADVMADESPGQGPSYWIFDSVFRLLTFRPLAGSRKYGCGSGRSS